MNAQTQTITAPTGDRARAAHTVQFANCRHDFGGALTFDAVVDGAYPDRRFCLWLSQPAEMYKGTRMRAPETYIAIPSLDCARTVVGAINASYHLCKVFRKGEQITVRLCGEGAPEATWQLAN